MGTRVLLADDSITIQKLVEMAFADTDFELLCVSDGKQAVDKLAAFQPQIILADAIMPIMDGYQVCEAVKANPITKDTPVILLTGRFQPYDEARAASVGIDERIVKPFVQDQLVELVQSFAPQDVDNTLDIVEPEEQITAPVETTPEPEPVEEEASVEPDTGPVLDLDSHSTIRVKPGDIKQFLQEPDEDEVLVLDGPSESLDDMVLDEEDLEPLEEDDLESLDSGEPESPVDALDDSFAASIDSINLDSGEEEELDETISLGSDNLDLPSFEAESHEPTNPETEEHVLDLDPEPTEVEAPNLEEVADTSEEVNFEIQEEELEKTVKLSPEEMLSSIEQEALEAQPNPEPDPLANEVFNLDPEVESAESLSDEPAELDLPEASDFSNDSFEMDSPTPVNIEPPSMEEEPEDLLDLDGDDSLETIEPIGEDPSDELEDLPEISDEIPEDSEQGEVLSLDEQDPDSIPTQSLDDMEEVPLVEHAEVDTGPIDDALNQTDESGLDEDGFPDLEPLDELDSLPEPEEEDDDPVMDLEDAAEAPDFSEIEEPLLGDLSEESMATLDEQELGPEPEFEELEHFSTEDVAPPLAEMAAESEEDTASNLTFNPEQSLDLSDETASAKVSLDNNQMDYLVEAVAKRVVALMGEQTVREIAWEVIPELSEAMIKKRIYELEKTVDDE